VLSIARLKLLQATVRAGSLSGAAREMGYTQPAVSHHIARLEEEMNTTLLIRNGRGVQLTVAGRALMAHADVILAQVAAAEEEVALIAGLRGGRVRLAAFPSGSAVLLPSTLSAFSAAYPDVEVSFVEAEPPNAVPLLSSGEVDVVVAFRYMENESGQGDRFAQIPLLVDPLHAVMAPTHPLAAQTEIDLGDLANAKWIAGCEVCRSHLVHACSQAGFEPKIGFALDDYVTVQGLVAADQGVALLPAMILHAARRLDVAIRPLAIPSARTVHALVHTTERRSPAVAAMLSHLRSASVALAAGPARALGIQLADQ
jgi:DNA-binding transcriptional LysR family regulator